MQYKALFYYGLADTILNNLSDVLKTKPGSGKRTGFVGSEKMIRIIKEESSSSFV